MGFSAFRQRGFTAYELLVGLALVALLATLAVPGFAGLRRSAGLTAAAHQLMGALHLARSSAAVRGVPAIVCLTVDDRTCLDTAGAVASGWLIYHSQGQRPGAPAEVEGELLQRFRLPPDVTISGTRPAITFWPTARAGTTATFSLCDLSGDSAGRAIVVSQTGRARAARELATCDR